jgi:hypothetical protein
VRIAEITWRDGRRFTMNASAPFEKSVFAASCLLTNDGNSNPAVANNVEDGAAVGIASGRFVSLV